VVAAACGAVVLTPTAAVAAKGKSSRSVKDLHYSYAIVRSSQEQAMPTATIL
jgi:hypothetical protein